MQIRYHLDEHIDHAVAEGLRRREIDVTTALDVNLIGATDLDQLQFASGQGRVMVTHDADFLRLADERIAHYGIAYQHPRRFTIGGMILALTALWRARTAEEMVNHIEFL